MEPTESSLDEVSTRSERDALATAIERMLSPMSDPFEGGRG